MSDPTNKPIEMMSIADALMEIPRNYTPEQKIVRERLYGKIDTENQPFDLDELSPTPLDPVNLSAHGNTYVEAAEILMQARLDVRLEEMGIDLPVEAYEAMSLEIHTEHMMQVVHNSESLKRLQALFLYDPSSISPKMADSIYLARLGAASPLSRLEVLAAHPEMKSIEDMKFTQPLDGLAVRSALAKYVGILKELSNQKNGVHLRMLPVSKQTIREVDVSESARPGIIVTKTTIAEAALKGVSMVLKKRDWYMSFPPEQDLGPAIRNIHIYRGKKSNLQHCGMSAYWTTKESDDAETAASTTVNRDTPPNIYVPPGYSTLEVTGFEQA
jgi:hypothetical protein